jgi:hypothetical protein
MQSIRYEIQRVIFYRLYYKDADDKPYYYYQNNRLPQYKDASGKLTGTKRRAFQAKVSIDYLNSKARKAETIFGWG